MTHDVLVLLVLAASVGAWVTAHVALLIGLRAGPGRDLVIALLVPPAAPALALVRGLRAWAALWLLTGVACLVAHAILGG